MASHLLLLTKFRLEKKDSAAGDIKTEVPTINQPEESEKATLPPNAPLAPPPKPNQNGESFYSEANGSHLAKEPNPFENAFGNPADTPGKPQLPGVTSLTSPASLLPGNTPGWPGSLRSGPLSPAMLTGPTGSNDYFNSDHHFAGSFPTPNESSLRTGLTPGGGGSMFPQPSPNSQAVYNQLQNGGATPGTLDFHRTAMTARAQSQVNNYNNGLGQAGATSQPQSNPNIQPDLDSKPYNPSGSTQQQDNQDPFGSHQTNDAANGLFMLAQAGGQQRNHSYPMPQQQPQNQQNYQQQGGQDQRGKGSIGSTMSGSTENGEQYSDDAETKPQARNGRGKKGAAGKAANGKRKTDEASGKGPANKKQRASMGPSMSEEPEEDDDNMEGMDDRKMTDEEKRKNFLERNRYVSSRKIPCHHENHEIQLTCRQCRCS